MKSKKMIQFENDFNAIELDKIFEEEVIDKRTGETDYIIFDIFIRGNSFVAQHVGLSAKQDKSNKIAFVSVKIDPDFSIDQNLEELHSACIDAICDSEYYTLPE